MQHRRAQGILLFACAYEAVEILRFDATFIAQPTSLY